MTILAKLCPTDTSAQLLYRCPADKNVFLTVSAMNRDKLQTPEAALYLVSELDLSVDTVTVDNPGTGLTTAAPAVTVTGSSTTSAALAVSRYRFTECAVSTAGSGYAVGDVIRLTWTGATVVTNCDVRVTAVNGSGGVTGLAISSGVVSTLPTNMSANVTKVTGNGTGLAVTGTKFGIDTVSVTTKGNGYKAAPAISFSLVTGAIATPVMTQVPEDDDLIEVGVALPYGKSPLIRDRLRLSPGQSVFVKSSVANAVNFHAYGVPTPV